MTRSFSPVTWASRTNVYEVNVRQYTPEGTFAAFATHLPRLRAMGVEVLWFMPITPISVDTRQGTLGSYYACSDYTAINPEFGTLEEFRLLVKQAQELGFKVIIDWVANHTGHDHIWTKTNPGFYKKNADGGFYDTNGWHDVIDLNFYDGNMRQAMIEAMQFWVEECGIDGFRCDMAHLIPLDFWKQARKALDQKKKLFWLAETEDLHYLEVFDCCYAWNWMHQTEAFFKGGADLRKLKEALVSYLKQFPAQTIPLFFTANHDENSWNGTEYEKYGAAAKTLAVFSICWKGIPLVYSGQELPNLKRLRFFDKDLIEWNDKPLLESFYRELLQLRSTHPAFDNSQETLPVWLPNNAEDYVLSFTRWNQGKQIVVLLNFSPNQLFIQLADGFVYGDYTQVFTKEKISVVPGYSFELKAWESVVLVK